MATEVLTRSKCDRCGAVDERKGAEGSVPPVHWASVRLVFRQAGDGWTNNAPHEWTMCNDCAHDIKNLAYSPPPAAALAPQGEAK